LFCFFDWHTQQENANWRTLQTRADRIDLLIFEIDKNTIESFVGEKGLFAVTGSQHGCS